MSEPSSAPAGDVFDPIYSPRRIEFWLDHGEELETLAYSPKSSAHIAEHLNREWTLLQVRLKTCLCRELHDADSAAVDPSCSHSPTSGAGFRAGPETALCILADLRRAADTLPPGWLATRKIWSQLMVTDINARLAHWRKRVHAGSAGVEREPAYARGVAIYRMAEVLGWQRRSETTENAA